MILSIVKACDLSVQFLTLIAVIMQDVTIKMLSYGLVEKLIFFSTEAKLREIRYNQIFHPGSRMYLFICQSTMALETTDGNAMLDA